MCSKTFEKLLQTRYPGHKWLVIPNILYLFVLIIKPSVRIDLKGAKNDETKKKLDFTTKMKITIFTVILLVDFGFLNRLPRQKSLGFFFYHTLMNFMLKNNR